MMNKTLLGVSSGILASVTYGMNPLFALPLYHRGMSPESVLFYRYFVAVAVLGVIMKGMRLSFVVPRRTLWLLAGAGALVAISSLTLFISYQYMDAGVASTLLFVYPVLVAGLMMVLFHERPHGYTWVSIALATGGIAFLCRGDVTQAFSWLGFGLVMLSSLSYAVYLIMIKQSSLRDMPAIPLTFYILLFGGLLFLVVLRGGWDLQCIPMDPIGISCTLALAVLPTVVSFYCSNLAVQTIGSTPTAILGALEPVTAVFFGVIIFGEILTGPLVIGMLLILLGVTILIAAPGLKKHNREKGTW